MNTIGLIFALGFVLLAVSGGFYSLYMFINPSRTGSDRLRDMTGSNNRIDKERDEAVEKIAERISALANPTDEDDRNKQRLMMIQAGFFNKNALEVFSAVRVVLSIFIPIVIVPILVSGETSYLKMFAAVVITAAMGYYTPVALVNSRITTRQAALMRPFPDALDLLVSSVEAGLGLDAAFRRVSEELEGAAPELAREFQMVNREIGTGVARLDALKHLAARTGVDEINALVNMITQAERFGTSIAKSLRIHSSMTRQKRMSKAEEEAAKVAPKLTVVMILFLMPCLMIVLLGPAAVNIKKALIDK